jgi:hypothetical protein
VSDHVGCGPDLIRSWLNGVTYSVGDFESLSKIMKKLASDPARLASMSKMAKFTAQQQSVAHAVDGVLHALDATVGALEAACAG